MNQKKLLGTLFVLVVLAVIPYGWIAQHVPAVDTLIDTLFATEFAHAVGHALIFFTLGTAILLVWPVLRRHPIRYMLIILVIALLQEGFQLGFKNRGIILNDITDIGTDLVAASVAFVLQRLRESLRGRDAKSRAAIAHDILSQQRHHYAEPPRRRR